MEREHLLSLIAKAEGDDDPYYRLPRQEQDDDELMSREELDIDDAPDNFFVSRALEEFEAAGFSIDAVPWGAIDARAREFVLNDEVKP